MTGCEPTGAQIEEALAAEEQRCADYWDGGSPYRVAQAAESGPSDQELHEADLARMHAMDRAWDEHFARRDSDSREAS